MTQTMRLERAPWPTTAAGEPVLDEVGVEAVLASVADFSADGLEVVVRTHANGASLRMIGMEESTRHRLYTDLPVPQRWDAAGRDYARRILRGCLLRTAEALRDQRVQLRWQDNRWDVVAAAMLGPTDSLPQALLDVYTIRCSGFAQAPVDGDTFTDPGMLAAAVAVVDTFHDAALEALRATGLPADALRAAEEALEAKRCSVSSAATLMRATLTAAEEARHRTTLVPRF